MKRFLRLLLPSSIACLLLLSPAVRAQQHAEDHDEAVSTDFRLGEVLALRYYTVADEDQAELESRWKTYVPRFYAHHLEGIDALLLKADRGTRLGAYVWLMNFETLEARNRWFPTEEGPFPEWEEVMALWDREHASEFEGLEMQDEDFTGDYVLVGEAPWEEPPAFAALGIHHFPVKEGMAADFERWVAEKWNPVAHSGEVWILFFKADRGKETGRYLQVFVLENPDTRDRYFPLEGESAEANEVFAPVAETFNEGATFLGERSDWSDWVVIR